MRIFPERARVSDEMTVWISPHYRQSTYGVRGHYESAEHTLPYVEGESMGCGFFARDSVSHAYRNFVEEQKKRRKQSLLTLLLGREFNINREIRRCSDAIEETDNHEKKSVLETYQACLFLARNAEYLYRCTDAIRKRIHGGHARKYMISALSHTKSRIGLLEHDIRSTQINISTGLDENLWETYATMVRVFTHVAVCHRIWHAVEHGGKTSFRMVYFDLGIFDFIQSPVDTPLMRDSFGSQILLYPDRIIVARSATDFDIIPIDKVTVTGDAVDVSTMTYRPPIHSTFHHHHSGSHSDSHDEKEHHHTEYVGRIHIDPIDTTFYLLDEMAARDFADTFNKLKSIIATSH